MEPLSIEERTLVATFRALGGPGKKELLRHASQQLKMEAAPSVDGVSSASGQCKLERGEERPESVSEPIFTE